MKKYTFHVSGTHCASCKILIEDILSEQTNISNAHVDLKNETVTLNTNETDQHNLAKVLNEKIKGNGYTLSVEKIKEEKKDRVCVFMMGNSETQKDALKETAVYLSSRFQS